MSGPPGAGKSTTCQLLARNNEFIYYEADCMMQMINPFTDVYAENPTLASFESRPLKVCQQLHFSKLFCKDFCFREFQKMRHMRSSNQVKRWMISSKANRLMVKLLTKLFKHKIFNHESLASLMVLN